MESSWWERGVILGGWAIAGLFALAALYSVFRDGGDQAAPPPIVVTRDEPSEPVSSVEGAVQAPRPTAERPAPTAGAPAAEATPQLVLSRCDLLRTSPNWSPEDREWFLASCLASGPVVTIDQGPFVAPPPGGYDSGSAAEVTAPPTPTPAAPVAAGDEAAAIALAVRWLGTDAPVAFDADAGSCSATPGGLQWVVTCRATLTGCAEAGACRRTISLCVYLQPPSVAPLESC
jgi:hypothetical protein